MDQLQRFVDLVSKTGDNLVVFDKYNPDNSFVILAINDYERLIGQGGHLGGLTEDELADKINRDIAIWKNEQILADANYDNLDWSVEESEADDDLEDYEEEELNYLYPEPEIPSSISPLEEAAIVAPDGLESQEILEDQDVDSSSLDDFESLSDLLDAKFDKSRINNWSIPKDRKQQAEETDEAAKYQTISY